MVVLESRLPELLKGTGRIADVDERLSLASLCFCKGMHGAAARFYDESLSESPKLAGDLNSGYRYNAARAAALASVGLGKDNPPLDDAARTHFRAKALDWLRAELAARTRMLKGGSKIVRNKVRHKLAFWRVDHDLAGVRDENALAKLPEAERESWYQFWADVDSLRKQAEELSR
jgi:hypothetical protein